MAKFKRFDPRNKNANKHKRMSKNAFVAKKFIDDEEYVYTRTNRPRVPRPRSENNLQRA